MEKLNLVNIYLLTNLTIKNLENKKILLKRLTYLF